VEIRALQTSYDSADGLAGLAVIHLVFVGRTMTATSICDTLILAENVSMSERRSRRLQRANQVRKFFGNEHTRWEKVKFNASLSRAQLYSVYLF
jgi:hypothetical protein